MRKNNKKGITLAIVIMLMLLLSIMGATFLGISLNQSRQAAIVDKGMQAYYLARSGAEAVLSAWQKNPGTLGSYEPVYLNSANNFVETNADEKGHFIVSITVNPNDMTQTIIHSIGSVGGIQKDVSVLINATSDQIMNPPTFVDGATTGFYDLPSGQFNPDPNPWPHVGSTKGVVKNQAKSGLKNPNKNTVSVSQKFERMLFNSTVSVFHNKIRLFSNVIYFTQPIDFDKPGGASELGSIELNIYGEGVPVKTFGGYDWGVVILQVDGKEMGYYFKGISGGITLSSNSDIATAVGNGNLVGIEDFSQYKNYFGNQLTVTSYSIKWTN